MAMRVFFIRHGETEWSLSGQHSGTANIALTERGESQAMDLVSSLRSFGIEHVWTSPLDRARKTCTLSGLSGNATVVPDLIEWDNGDYEGLTSKQIHAQRPGWEIFRDGCPAGEMHDQVAARADRLIERLATVNGSVALFSHSHFGRSFAARWIGLPIAHAQSLILNTASISILSYEHEVPVISLWNWTPFDRLVKIFN